MLASAGEVVGILIIAGLAVIGVVSLFASRFIKIVQQGSVGVVKRFGEFKSVDQPGLHVLMPFATGWTRSTSASSPGPVTSRR